MASPPLISCIMPTRNRRRFVAQAVRYFLRQDYPARELVIVDDGEDAVEDLIAADERIRYLRLDRRVSLGEKRNLACRESSGSLIAHWDDDDWSAPNRLSRQVACLKKPDVEFCSLQDHLFYHLAAGQVWAYARTGESNKRLSSGTFCYRREAWSRQPYEAKDAGHARAFVQGIAPAQRHVLTDRSLYVAVLHDGNTEAKNLADPQWQRLPIDTLQPMFAADRGFYVQLRRTVAKRRKPRARLVPSSSARTATGPEGLTVAAPFLVYDGYGSMAEYLVRGMHRVGAKVGVHPLTLDPEGLSPEFLEILRSVSPRKGGPVLYFCWPRADLDRFNGERDLFIYTMWEGSRLPAGWAGRLNRARAVLAPTRFVARVLQESGVKVPIEVVPQGIDPAVYALQRRPVGRGLTTLIVGTVISRKNVREGIAAWKLAFGEDPTARLLIKSRFKYGNYAPDDPRIRYVDDNEKTRGILHWYREADVLLALGNEGFGLPLVEAMATGLPVVALDAEGQQDVCEEARALVLPVPPAHYVPFDDAPFGSGGLRSVPDPEAVAERLRWVAANRSAAQEMGRKAAAWVREHRNVWMLGPRVLDVMERYMHPQRPLRHAVTLCTPSLGQVCGVARYTELLAQGLPGVRVTTAPLPSGAAPVVHFQHEPGLVEDVTMLRQIRTAKSAGAVVVVTEHNVGPVPRGWEREADVLVSLTRRGTRLLQARRGEQQVVHQPHGCPTWFPPRKQTRGRTIGLFGFMAPYKGFEHVLKVLQVLPDTDLLVISHVRSPERLKAWQAATAGLPVRHEAAYMEEAEAAHRLAAEADVLVYWYDEVQHASASGAVRIGLASGVPVLTSPTGWFEDLKTTTYQPDDLVAGVRRLLEDEALRSRVTAAAKAYCDRHAWATVRLRHQAFWDSIIEEQETRKEQRGVSVGDRQFMI